MGEVEECMPTGSKNSPIVVSSCQKPLCLVFLVKIWNAWTFPAFDLLHCFVVPCGW